jgi:hypothetical protein
MKEGTKIRVSSGPYSGHTGEILAEDYEKGKYRVRLDKYKDHKLTLSIYPVVEGDCIWEIKE